MKYLPDLAAVAVLVLFAVIGARKGLIRACADFLGSIIAMVAASMLSNSAATWVFDTFFRTSLEEKISAAIHDLSLGEAVQAVFKAFPGLIQRAFSAAGITEGSVVAQLQDSTKELSVGITDALSPMLIGLISAMALVVLFVLFLVLVRALASLLTGFFELPILHGLNTVCGAVFGALVSLSVLWVVFACVRIFKHISRPSG